MFIAYVAVTVVTMVASAYDVIASLLRAQFVLDNASEVGLPQSWLPWLTALKAAGVAGLLLGLLGVWVIGVAAATGLVLFFVGALIAHIRAAVYHNIAGPIGFLALATASLVLTLAN